MYTEYNKENSLQQLLFGWVNWPQKRPSTRVLEVRMDPADVHHWVEVSIVQQLVTSMRMQGVVEDDNPMLQSLESLVIAGEISFKEFIGRLLNLFPQALDTLDTPLKMRIAAILS